MYASTLTNAGLYTFPNDLSNVPVGALLQADNMVINRDGIADSRRGIALAGNALTLSAGQFVNKIFGYQNRLLLHYGTTLAYDSTGTFVWTNFTGTYNPPTGMPKIHGLEANKNYYFTTSAGVYKIDAYNHQPVLSGGIPALDGTAVVTGGSGFLAADTQCVYQIVWGYNDANGNLILGNPSLRILVSNTSAVATANAAVTFTIPQGVTTSYFYQIYRTPQTTYSATPASNVPPGPEPQLVTQLTVTSGQISAGTVTYTDVTPDSLLGAFLYTNPSQQGATQTNDRPPLAVDFCTFSGMTFYANCSTLQNVSFNLISVGSPNGIQNADTLVVNGTTFTGAASQNNAIQQFKVDTSGTVAQNIDATARNIVACLNANAATTNVYAYYTSGYNALPGMMTLIATGFAQGIFVVTSSRGGAFSPNLPSAGTTFPSSNNFLPNNVFVSKLNQPEAVPLSNSQPIGGGDQPIYRVIPLRDRVVVLKADGVFTITGSTPSTLQITPLDTTIILIAPESAVLLNNTIYCMTTQGVASITESGVSIKSRPIELDLLKLTAPQFTNFTTATNGIAYESERLYMLCVPTLTSDTTATQTYCYNWITNAWTRWTLGPTTGLVNPFDNKLYIGNSANPSFLYQERKAYTSLDYVDDVFAVTITASSGKVITISTTPASTYIGSYLAQGSNSSQITAINTGAKTVTVTDTLTWSNAAAQVQVPISVALQWCPITASFPHFMKSWNRCNFWFSGGNFSNLTAGFTSDISGFSETVSLALQSNAPWGQFQWGLQPWGGTTNFAQAIQTLVPGNKSWSRWIQPSLSSSIPFTNIAALGCTVSYDIISDVSR